MLKYFFCFRAISTLNIWDNSDTDFPFILEWHQYFHSTKRIHSVFLIEEVTVVKHWSSFLAWFLDVLEVQVRYDDDIIAYEKSSGRSRLGLVSWSWVLKESPIFSYFFVFLLHCYSCRLSWVCACCCWVVHHCRCRPRFPGTTKESGIKNEGDIPPFLGVKD